MDVLLEFLSKFIGIDNPLNLLLALLGCITYIVYARVSRISHIQNEHQVKFREVELAKELTWDKFVEKLNKGDMLAFISQYMHLKLIKDLIIATLIFVFLWLVLDIIVPQTTHRKNKINLDSAKRAIEQRYK